MTNSTMTRVVANGDGGDNTTRFSERGLPTSYPTYLGSLPVPTYFPTHPVPTKKETKTKDNKDQLRNKPSTKPTTPPSIQPTTRPTTRPTTHPSKMPTFSLTEFPTVSQEGDRTSRKYGDRTSSSRIGNEDIVDDPAPESTARQGQSYSRKHTPEPTVLQLSIPTERSTDNKDGQIHEDKSAKLHLSFEVPDNVPSQSLRESVNKEVDEDRTAKLHLSFEINDVPSQSPFVESVSLNLGKAYDKLDDVTVAVPAPTVLSDEPTYYIFPTSSPIDGISEEEAALSISVPTYMPTSTENERSSRYGDLDASLSTTQLTNDIDLASIFEKRTCPGYPLGIDPLAPKVEEEVFFAYSVQTNTDFSDDDATTTIELAVEWIQLWLLDDVASQLLLCPTNDGRLLSDTFEQPVSRVYYNMEDDTVATLSECAPTFSNATDCAIVQSALYLTVDVRHSDEARVNALSVINSQLGRRGMYENGDIIHVSYLGPSMNEMNVIGSSSHATNSTDSSSINLITFYIAIGVVSLAICALAAFLVMVLRVRKERKWANKSSNHYTGYRHTPTDFTHSQSSRNSSLYVHDSTRF